MKIKIAFLLSLLGVLFGTALRCVQMLFFFDYDTGFVTDSGAFTWAYCGVTLTVGIACMVLCRLDKGLFGTMQRGRSWGCGFSGLAVSLFLLFGAFVLFKDTYTFFEFGVSYSIEPGHIGVHIPFAALSALFGIASMAVSVLWLKGGKMPGVPGVMWAVGVVWGLYYMILTFFTYSPSATTQENLYTVGGGALMLMFLLAEGKLLSGTGGRKAARQVYIFGLPAVVFWLTYFFSNTVLVFCGHGYAAEMPFVIQLMMFALSVHAVTLLKDLQDDELFVPSLKS